MKNVLNRAVSQMHFKCNETWFVQKNGWAIGATLVVILANLRLKENEHALKMEIPKLATPANYCKERCRKCNKKVAYRSKGVDCEGCLNLYQVNFGDLSDIDYQNIAELVWYCKSCICMEENEAESQGVKVFLRYVDTIARTVKFDPETVP